MANLISVERVSKAYGPRALLDGVSLGVNEAERIGIVGRNGAGKSTLLSLLAGTAEPDSGRIARTSGLRVGYLPQSDSLTGTVAGNAFGDRAWERDSLARSVANELLAGLPPDADVSRLSGGERRRVALAALLVAERDILLLDEPTNHLDIEAIDWVGRHLAGRGCAVVVVSHDRWLLDTVCDQMWEIDGGRVYPTEGGYSAYVLAQAERQRGADADEQRRRNLARKELAWLRRGPQARGTKPRFRVQAANALIAAEPPARDRVELTQLATARLGKTVLELEDVTVKIGDRTLLDDITWLIGPGDRVGMVGVNGAGKTTLLRLLARRDDPPEPPGRGPGPAETMPDPQLVSGTVVRGRTIRVGHLSQELAELDPAQRARESVEEIRMYITVGKRELSAGQLLERLGFDGDRQWTPIGDLSGGERRRLQMLRLLMNEPNVLLLDEPTNDLDIDMLTELEDILDGWPGTLVIVSHDRYFLERVTDRVAALLGDGKISFLGGVDEYLERSRARRAALAEAGAAARRGPGTAASGGTGGVSYGAQRAAQRELQRLERQIERASARATALHDQLAANATDYEKLTELGTELNAVEAEKAGLEERWLELAAELEG
ncbi:MAG TPA: ABC-F family ATP-binding cassette domain-containing protein [Trebonia sp.]|jgi:ATP-binding cassette subfamily F protein uup|nr:ABC-F family ATP-binding cassette domain-containing protein [Trebonia sp.]